MKPLNLPVWLMPDRSPFMSAMKQGTPAWLKVSANTWRVTVFGDSLRSKQFPVYKLVCSSILRTQEDVENLRKSGNPNASDNSAHCYGTTFDITYTRYWRDEETDEFMQPYELTKVLAEVLRDEKKAGRVLVKYERKEHCFHITATQK